MKLNEIADNVYYIDSAVNLGLVANGSRDALLVDTGIDESAAKKVLKLIEGAGLTLRGIIITHAHADHCGGAPRLVKSTGAEVYAPAVEKDVLEFPLWEPVYLFSGVYPPPPLHNKFLLAPGVKVDSIISPGMVTAGGSTVEIVGLPGHSINQVGVSAGGVLFCADAVIAPELIEKHGIPLNCRLLKALESFDLLEGRTESLFVPAHGDPVSDIMPVTGSNRARVINTLDFISQLLGSPRTAEEITAVTCENFGVSIGNMGKFYLMSLTINAYLGHLLEIGSISASYQENRQVFERL